MLDFVHHLLTPRPANNHRSRLLYNSSIFVLVFLFLFATLATHVINKTHPEVLGISYSISDSELLTLVNQERAKDGLPALTMNSALSDAARRKAADMFAKNYWAHFAPDGSTSPWGFIKDAGYSYSYAGENLAKGFTDSGSTVNAWMNSPSHRDNIMSDKYREIGFAIVPGTLNGEETVLVVEMFGSRNTDTIADIPSQAVEAIIPTQAPLEPTAAPQAVAGNNSETPIPSQIPIQQVVSKPLIASNVTSKASVAIILSLLAFVFLMDVVIVERKKIPRVIGHNLDHIMLILLFLLFMVLLESGVVV